MPAVCQLLLLWHVERVDALARVSRLARVQRFERRSAHHGVCFFLPLAAFFVYFPRKICRPLRRKSLLFLRRRARAGCRALWPRRVQPRLVCTWQRGDFAAAVGATPFLACLVSILCVLDDLLLSRHTGPDDRRLLQRGVWFSLGRDVAVVSR